MTRVIPLSYGTDTSPVLFESSSTFSKWFCEPPSKTTVLCPMARMKCPGSQYVAIVAHSAVLLRIQLSALYQLSSSTVGADEATSMAGPPYKMNENGRG